MKSQTLLVFGAFAALTFSACGSKASDGINDAVEAAVESVETVVASATTQMDSRSGTEVTGTVRFSEIEVKAGDRVVDHRIVVAYDFQGLPPGEARGFHIHEHGDCSAPDASSAGGHFNPAGHDHGAHDADDAHAGDLGNVTANANGRAVGTIVVPASKFTVRGNEDNNIIGRAVIVHTATDDLVSQPTGDAGARAACGVIQAD